MNARCTYRSGMRTVCSARGLGYRRFGLGGWVSLVLAAACADPPAPKPGPTAASGSAAASAPASQPAPATIPGVSNHGGSRARHQLAYRSKSCPGDAPCVCEGALKYGQNALKKIGVTPKKLAGGTLCLLADFDGNGTQDAAFVDDKYGDPKLASQVQVLMFDQVGLMATAILPKRVRSLGLSALSDGRTALVEPGPMASRFRFVYADGQFTYEPVDSKQ